MQLEAKDGKTARDFASESLLELDSKKRLLINEIFVLLKKR